VSPTDRLALFSYKAFFFASFKTRKKFDFLKPDSLFYKGLCFSRQESDHMRICEDVYFASNFLFSFSFQPALFCLRSALWLPWRHSKPETNYSSPAAASLLCLEHPLRLVAPLLLLFIALSCMVFASGDQ